MNDQSTNQSASSDQFLKDMGLASLDKDRQERVVGKLLRLLDFNVLHRLAETLTEKQMDQLSDLLSKDDVEDAEIKRWLENNVPNYVQIVDEEAKEIKQQHEDVMNKVMGP